LKISGGIFVPAKSRKQQKFFAMCAHNPSHANGKCPDMPKAKMREFSHKPKGGYK
jgi:hypothetical protein